ncbi:acetyl esterase [Sphingomonas desiccabilis]|nr:acetyl esterase [Sphingomonas desiccabilis]
MTVFVRPDVRAFLGYLENMPGPRMHELEPAAARAQLLATKDVADLPVGTLAVIRDCTIPAPHGDLRARLFDARPSREPGPVILFLHGGGFVIGDLDSHASACAEIARMLDLPVVALDYRLAPEHPWPAAPDDAETAARWLAAGPAVLERGVTSLVLAGDSAGATLAIVTAMALRDRPAAAPVIAQWPIYPVTDTTREYPSYGEFAEGYLLTRESLAWFGQAYRAESASLRASPLLGTMAEMPPALVLTAGLDPLRDQGRAYAAALAEAGVAVTYREARGNVHGFLNLRRAIPSSQGDLAGALVALRQIVTEAEAERVLAQAAG